MKTLTRDEALQEQEMMILSINETFADYDHYNNAESALLFFYNFIDAGQGSYERMTEVEFDCANDIGIKDFNNLGASEQMTMIMGC